MPTKDGVFYDLKSSPHKVMYGEQTFYFSSWTHAKSFLNKAHVRRGWLNDSFKKRFKFAIETNLIAIFQLYFQVETRGCYVEFEDGSVLTCRENLELNGLKPSVKDSIQPLDATTMLSDEKPSETPLTPNSCPQRQAIES